MLQKQSCMSPGFRVKREDPLVEPEEAICQDRCGRARERQAERLHLGSGGPRADSRARGAVRLLEGSSVRLTGPHGSRGDADCLGQEGCVGDVCRAHLEGHLRNLGCSRAQAGGLRTLDSSLEPR